MLDVEEMSDSDLLGLFKDMIRKSDQGSAKSRYIPGNVNPRRLAKRVEEEILRRLKQNRQSKP
jgi:hypothetical protein